MCKDRADSAVVRYIFQYANGTDRGRARTHSGKIRHFSVLRVQAEKDALMERHVQVALKWDLARSLIARVADAKAIANKQVPICGVDKFVDWIDDEIRVWRRSRFLYSWHPRDPSSSSNDVVCRRISIKRDNLPIPVDNVRPGCGPVMETKNDGKGVHRLIGGVVFRENNVELNRCWQLGGTRQVKRAEEAQYRSQVLRSRLHAEVIRRMLTGKIWGETRAVEH